MQAKAQFLRDYVYSTTSTIRESTRKSTKGESAIEFKRQETIAEILWELDNEVPEERKPGIDEYKLWGPELELGIEDLRRNIKDMEDPRFWL